MALFERTYDEAIGQIEALLMIDLSPKNKIRLTKVMNLAATRAKRKVDFGWERTLVVDEPRTVSRGYLQTSEDSFNVYGAGTDAVNGLYVRNGSNDSKPKYTLYDTDGTTSLYDLAWDNGDALWAIFTGAYLVSTAEYLNTDPGATPPTSGWASTTGESPAPLLVDVAEIETALYYRRSAESGRYSNTYEFAADSYGLKPYANRETEDTIFVTYVKKLADVYGDGGGEVSDIPAEWFDYMTLYAAYMYQSSQRQDNPSAAFTMALREVEASLEDEMMRMEATGLPQTIRQNVETRLSYSSI